MNIGERIKQRRLFLNMSQEELAHRLGYKSRSSINKIELDGQDLPADKISAIAKVLDTTPAYIMGWEDENTQPYYLDDETALLAQQIHDDPELRVLMDASRKLKPEELQTVIALIKTMKGIE